MAKPEVGAVLSTLREVFDRNSITISSGDENLSLTNAQVRQANKTGLEETRFLFIKKRMHEDSRQIGIFYTEGVDKKIYFVCVVDKWVWMGHV